MVTFLDVPLTKEEQITLTGIIVDMAEGQKISNEDLLHEILKRVKAYDTLQVAKREIRKLKHQCEIDNDELCKEKIEAYNNALNLIKG